MPQIVFPVSTDPGINRTENGGRLINAYVDRAADGSRAPSIRRRAPGLTTLFTAGSGAPRGALTVGNILYVVNDDKAYSITLSGGVYTVTALAGTVGGSGPVFMARNMNASTDVLIVHSAGMNEIASGSVSSFSDGDLPTPNSLTYLDGFFIFGIGDGRLFASGLNDTTVDALDYATAESSPDGGVRAVARGRELLAFGQDSTEFWSNTGNETGFPFTRGHVMTLGLYGAYSIGGAEAGFPEPLFFVASDRTVRHLTGYEPVRISTPTLERLIDAVEDPDTLTGCCFAAAGHLFYALSSPSWTWVYDLTTGAWHERKSIGQDIWRAAFTVYAFDKWLAFDAASGKVFHIDPTAKREDTDLLVFEVWSAQAHGFPARTLIKRASFDMMTGVGIDTGIEPIETDPKVEISWSDDGGRTWGAPVQRRLGSQGEKLPIDVFRCGLAGRLGRQWRLAVSDPVEVSLIGGAMDVEGRAA